MGSQKPFMQRTGVLAGLSLIVLAAGCTTDPFAPPVRFATTRGAAESTFMQQASLLTIFETAPFKEVQSGVGQAIGRNTQFIMLEPEQIQPHLASGYVQFAFVDAGDEAEVTKDGAGEVIARPVFKEHPPTCTALFVVAKDSPIQSLSDLKGKRVAFGPANHPALHWAALEAIEAAGVPQEELQHELITFTAGPQVNSYQFHINSIESAKAALLKVEADVGVVDKADYDKWPDEGGGEILSGAATVLSLSVAKDQLRIIGETEPVLLFPSGAVVASSKADPKMVDEVRDYLTKKLPTNKNVVDGLGLVGYEAAGGTMKTASNR